jgi:hypothetical protein
MISERRATNGLETDEQRDHSTVEGRVKRKQRLYYACDSDDTRRWIGSGERAQRTHSTLGSLVSVVQFGSRYARYSPL